MSNTLSLFVSILQTLTFLMVLAMFFNYLNRQSYSSSAAMKTPVRWFVDNDQVFVRLEDGRMLAVESLKGQAVLFEHEDPQVHDDCIVVEGLVEDVSGHYIKLFSPYIKDKYHGWYHVREASIVQIKTIEGEQPGVVTRADIRRGLLG